MRLCARQTGPASRPIGASAAIVVDLSAPAVTLAAKTEKPGHGQDRR